jgi:tetratricopeptide (TPR) repeat protein
LAARQPRTKAKSPAEAIGMKILAGSNREKAVALEQLTADLLDELGYDDFRAKISSNGLAIDLKARHRSGAHRLFCYGRTQPHEVRVDELKKIHRRYARDRRRDKRLVGVFFSLAGFQEGARKWFSGLDSAVKGDFHLFGADRICTLLRRAKLITSPEQIANTIDGRVMADRTAPNLVFARGRFYWTLQIHARKHRYYVVFDAYGSLVSRRISQAIKRIDRSLKGTRPLDLSAREKVLLALAEAGQKNIEALAREIRETLDDLRDVLQGLVSEGFLTTEFAGQPRWRADRYSLKPGFDVFLSLARQFLDSPNRFKFLGSNFAAQMLVVGLVPHLEERFHLKFAEEDRAWLTRLLAVSPSALSHALFAPADYFLHAWQDLETRLLPSQEKERLRGLHLNKLHADLLIRYGDDLEDNRFDDVLRNKGVQGHLYRVTAKAATPDELFFSIRGESYLPLTAHPSTGAPPARRGVGPAPALGGDLALNNGKALLHMQEYEQAAELFDRAIRDLKDPNKLLDAWNSKGVCLLQQKRFEPAILCFNEALRYDTNHKEAWLHKAICLKELGDANGAIRCVKRALEIDPSYDEAREFLRSV